MKQTRERATKQESEKTVSMNFRIESELKEQYIEFCEKNGYSYGKRLRAIIKKELGYEK